MNTIKLRNILSSDLRTKKYFIDVFALDEFKRYFSGRNRYKDGISEKIVKIQNKLEAIGF